MRLPKSWTPHTVLVEPFLGQGANGPLYGPQETIKDVYIHDQAEIVRDNTGVEIVSSASVRFNLDDLPVNGSKVTIWPGTRHETASKLFKVTLLDHPGWPSLGIGWLK